MPPRRRLGLNAPPDDDNPHTNLPPSFPARFMTVLELYRAQRDTPSQAQVAPPSPTFQVQYQPDAPPVYHTLFAILSSQATVVAQEELDTIREAIPSPPETPSPHVVIEAVERVLPVLSHDTVNRSIRAMEQILVQSSAPNELEINDVPPEVWAVLRTAVPTRGSTINEAISRTPSFAEARDSTQSNASSPMDDSPTSNNPPLFLPGSSGEDQLSVSYHPQSIETNSPLPHVIGDQAHPISISSASFESNREIITRQLEHAPTSLEVDASRLTPAFRFPTESQEAALNLRSLINMQVMDGSLASVTTINDHYYQAIGAMNSIRDELNQAVEGHSHYFLREPLTILEDPAFPVQSEELRRILDLAGAALSAGPRLDSDQEDIWRLLRPSDWYRAATHTMAAILRGAVRTKHVGRLGNFPITPLRDEYRRSNNLPHVETQRDLLEAMALQIAEQLSLDNGPYMPQDSVDGIRATVWRAHEAQIRAAVTAKANEVEDRLTTLGLSDLIDKLLNEASWEEITSTIREDIELQVRSKFNNQRLAEENRAYHALIEDATKTGKDKAAAEALQTYVAASTKLKGQKERQAQKDADDYYSKLVERAKEQARIKADSEFARLLADEHSAIAPRVDKEIKEEYTKLVEERRRATVAQLNALTQEEEKKLVLAAAARLGMSISNGEPATKKTKIDQRKARPAPITPRGRSNSVVSISSAQSTSRKRAYSPSEITAPVPLPDREEQKTPTPDEQKTPTPKEVTTVTFEIKAEPTPQPSFATPSTPSVIRDAIEIAQDVSLRSSTSSIHNEANHMAIDPEHLDLANIFPPGIPPPPLNVSLPPPMSQTPQFGGAEAHEDGAAPSVSPEVLETNASEIRLFALMQKFNQPIWDTIHRIEQALGDGRIPRAPPRAGPGYRSEHMHKQAARVPSAPNGPEVTTQEPRERQASQAAPPFPSEPPVPERPTPSEISMARVDDDDQDFPPLGIASRGQRRKQNNTQRTINQRRSVPGAVGPDDGHIAIMNNNSRIKPLFANVITREAVAQQQNIRTSANQARLAQGRNPSGNQGTRKAPSDGNMTEVTVIRFGGLDDKEEERKFRARNPVEIIQSVQHDLARQTKNPPAVLSGRWSTTADTTGNFVYTIAGIIPPRDLMSLKTYLCRPFKGRTELVPTKGWTWIQLRLVPTEDLDGCVWGPDDLLNQFIANPCFQDALICIAPHWQGNPLNNDKERSTVLAAIIDEDNAICQNALTHGVRMFGAQVKFLSSPLAFPTVPHARAALAKRTRRVPDPSGRPCKVLYSAEARADPSVPASSELRVAHPSRSRQCRTLLSAGLGYQRRQPDSTTMLKVPSIGPLCELVEVQNATKRCQVLQKTDHHARSRKCLKRGDFNPPRLPERNESEPFQVVGKKRNTKGKQRADPYSPPLSAFIVPEVKIFHLPCARRRKTRTCYYACAAHSPLWQNIRRDSYHPDPMSQTPQHSPLPA
ncbi:hypothetical protein V8E53_005952 [Lactarius tabidus]